MFVTVQLLTGLLITTVISHVVGPLVQKETLPKITFRKIGPLVASSDSGYLISRIPLEQMIAKIRIHEMLSHQFKKVADEFNQTEKLAEFSLHGHQMVTQSQEMVYRMLILLSLMEDAGDRKLSLLDTYVSEHLALLIDLKRYVDQSGTFQSLVQGMVLSDEQFRRIMLLTDKTLSLIPIMWVTSPKDRNPESQANQEKLTIDPHLPTSLDHNKKNQKVT